MIGADPALSRSDFTAFFRALWGEEVTPFPWQQELLFRVVTTDATSDGSWPGVLDLPTGSGKTAALDVAVFHLALEAHKGSDRRAPLRMAFVVDRRLIVDDAHARARHISLALNCAVLDDGAAAKLETRLASKPERVQLVRRCRADPVVRSVALRLRGLAGEGQPPLMARALRGGMPMEDDWSQTPVQPTILCSTVDQVGSRILFRGYGVSNGMKPIHAGLLGSDCLILLDEAHLSEPFRQTLTSIRNLRRPDAAPFEFAVLTATPAEKQTVQFKLSDDDRAHPVLSRRLNAEKKALLVEVAGKQGVDTESRRADVAAEYALSLVEKLRVSGVPSPAVGVVLNRVSRARMVFERLEAERKDDVDLMLLIGPARAADRTRHTDLLDPIRTQKCDGSRRLDKPLIVVATQTIEVGVDVDFDGLVTEAAALDALRQRFGRLNRAGRDIKAQAVVLAHKEDLAPKADDTVYGNRIRSTWNALNRWQSTASDGCVDFGIRAMEAALEGEAEPLANLVTDKPDAPVLMPAYIDLLSQTSPIPKADPAIELFLHGPSRSQATVRIIWRADIRERQDLQAALRGQDHGFDDGDEDRKRLVDLLTLMPPRAAEAVEVPIWAARAWLERPSAGQAAFSDAIDSRSGPGPDRDLQRLAFRWLGKDDEGSGRNPRAHEQSKCSRVITPVKLRRGDLIVVPASYGGCDKWGWNPGSADPVTDVADDAAMPYRKRRFAVRVTPEFVVQGLHAERRDADPSMLRKLAAVLSDTEGTVPLLEAVRELEFLPESLRSLLALFDDRNSRRFAPKTGLRRTLRHEFVYDADTQEPRRGVVFVAARGLKGDAGTEEDLAAVPSTESEDLGAISDRVIPLLCHSRHVGDWAAGFCKRAGLESKLSADIILSSYLHDLGKADERYQAYYAGGSPYGPEADKVLAKSGQGRLPAGAWERAGLPAYWRHEALSVRLARVLPEFNEHAHDPELVLWLIGTHHGYGRPLFPHVDPKDGECRTNLLKAVDKADDLPPGEGPQSPAFRFNECEWIQIFERLKRRYGIWGLARLEGFVRLSDHRASEEGKSPGEQRQGSAN